ncbi:MAG: PepSY domain-containing protein [Methylophilaceae bacterium]
MRLLLIMALLAIPATVFASADCTAYPKAEWAPEDTLKKALLDEGYTIKKFKVDGNCYEIYGLNPQGQKVEIYFDTKTLAIIKAEAYK